MSKVLISLIEKGLRKLKVFIFKHPEDSEIKFR